VDGRVLVDGAMSVEVPSALARDLGATHVISVHLPAPPCPRPPADMFKVVRRCFQIMQTHNEAWRLASDVVITPDLQDIDWDGFDSGPALVAAGEQAALAALPIIHSWLADGPVPASAPAPGPGILAPAASIHG
jgi:NTE family protein